MQNAFQNFEKNMERVRELGGLYKALQSLTTSAIDKSDILRAQIVLCVSALDFYVHELVCLGMLETFDGFRPSTSAYDRYKISINVLKSTSPFREAFENEIRERHSYLAFQQPDKIADAVKLISPITLWDEVATELGSTAKEVKDRLRQIVDRRNKIAHEADIDPSYPGSRWPIVETDVEASVLFIENISRTIEQKAGQY